MIMRVPETRLGLECQAPSSSLVANPSVILGTTSLRFVRRPSFDTWETIGQNLFALTESSTWWIADWLVLGESVFKDRYEEAIKRTQLNYQTLRNYAWVARRFDVSRRRDNLTFGHHAEVAALERPEQDYWLRKAEEFRWSRNHLRTEVRASLRERDNQTEPQLGGESISADCSPSQSVESKVQVTLKLHLRSDQLKLFEAIAADYGRSLQDWAVEALDVAANSHGNNGDETYPPEVGPSQG